MKYSLSFKETVIKAYKSKKFKCNELIKLFNISNGTLFNWVKKEKVLKEKKQRRKKVTDEIILFIKCYVLKNYNFKMNKLIELIKELTDVTIKKTIIYDILKSLKIKKKKVIKKFYPLKPEKLKLLSNKLKEELKDVPLTDIISIDESSFDTHINYDIAWAEKGKNVKIALKNQRKRYTVVAAISNNKIVNLHTIKGASNAETFKTFLMETIKKLDNTKQYKFILDNARIHHSKIVKEYITNEQRIKLIFNIPYTPETNPIENIFSVSKNNIKGMKVNDNNFIEKIKESFNNIKSDTFANCYNKSFKFLNNL
jgi:transposase